MIALPGHRDMTQRVVNRKEYEISEINSGISIYWLSFMKRSLICCSFATSKRRLFVSVLFFSTTTPSPKAVRLAPEPWGVPAHAAVSAAQAERTPNIRGSRPGDVRRVPSSHGRLNSIDKCLDTYANNLRLLHPTPGTWNLTRGIERRQHPMF